MLRQVTGNLRLTQWLNVELPKVEVLRPDLLGATPEGGFIPIELRCSDVSNMAIRMAEYARVILSNFQQLSKQIVLYAGQEKLSMEAGFSGLLVPVRPGRLPRLESVPLPASVNIEDNLLVILTRLQKRAANMRQILKRIATLKETERRAALAQFLMTSALKRLADTIQEEAQKMPILNDILDHNCWVRLSYRTGKIFFAARWKVALETVPAWVEAHLEASSRRRAGYLSSPAAKCRPARRTVSMTVAISIGRSRTLLFRRRRRRSCRLQNHNA